MSWLYSRALVAAYSEGICLGGAPSAPSSGTPTQLVFSSHGKMTDFSRRSLSGMTCKPLTDADGEAVLTSFLADFHAKTLAPPGEAQALTESALECGRTWQGSLAKYDPDSRSWKTPQCSLVEGLDAFSATWPRWGMMRNGVSWELPTPVLLTSGTESGLGLRGVPMPTVNGNHNNSKTGGGDGLSTWAKKFPTPCTVDSGSLFNRSASPGAALRPTLGAMAKFGIWPTPCASDNRPRGTPASTERRMKIGKQVGLEAMVKWATPTAHNAKEGAYPAEYTRKTPSLASQAGGPLNPTWVEWLMGWPLGWTDLRPLETGKFQLWLDSHGRR